VLVDLQRFHFINFTKFYFISFPVFYFPPVNKSTNEESCVLESWLRRNFVRVLVYCNTAMLMPDASGAVSITDLPSLKSSLNAESPDEVALIVAAAQHCGALLTVRNGNSIESKGMERYAYNTAYAKATFNTASDEKSGGVNAVTTPVDGSSTSFTGPSERLELLAVNEFDSDRKMMSVLVRITDTAGPCAGEAGSGDGEKEVSRIFLLCKGELIIQLLHVRGNCLPRLMASLLTFLVLHLTSTLHLHNNLNSGADSSVLKNCRRSGTAYTQLCMSHIENFANVGLRTLVAACRVIPEDAAQAWLKDYKAAGNSIQQRAELLSAAAKQIEKDMIMLGAIGIEDELQDGVPEVGSISFPPIDVNFVFVDSLHT